MALFYRLFISSALLLASHQALAYEPLNTDDAKTVGRGWNQIELYYYNITSNGASEQSTGTSPGEEFLAAGNSKALPVTYTYGFTDALEGMIAATYFMTPRGDYSPIANYVLGIKWQYFGIPSDGLGLSVKPTISVPAGTEQQAAGLGNASTNYGLNLIGSYYWKSFDIHLNLTYDREPYNTNYSVAGDTGIQRKNVYGASFAPVWNFAPKTSIALDLGVGTNTPTASPTIANTYAMAALMYSPIASLDLGVAYLISGDEPGQALSTGRLQKTGSNRFEIGATFRFK
jgi:hypothetical protein